MLYRALLLAAAVAAQGSMPSVLLNNTANAGVYMPATGFGTGGYTGNASQPYGAYPECFNGCFDAECATPDPPTFSSCGEYVDAAVTTWLQLGGRRIDNSDSYHNQKYVGIAMAASGIPRADLFLTSKVGPYLSLGYDDTLAQFDSILQVTGAGYVDLLLIHWPSCASGGGCGTTGNSTDAACQWGAASYNDTQCRLNTWSAMLHIWRSGGARAVGVSNFNISHLQEIQAAGLPLPAVNQIPHYLFHSAVQAPLIAWCQAQGILVNAYSSLGVPDRKTFPPPMTPTTLQDPVLLQIAAAHGRSAAEVILAWQWQLGLVSNPRSQNAGHMLQNMAAYTNPITLSAAEMAALAARPQD